MAETSAAVERVAQQLRRRRSRINVAMGILATVILCVGALLSYTYFPSFLLAMQTPKLCGDGVQRTDRGIVDGKPTEELAMYLDGLKNGKYAFNWGITGTEAAKQLGFSRRFATTYGEIIHRVETTRSAKIDEITAFVGSILDKERSIDKLAQQRDWRLPAIVYLRSYQVLECGFPTELMSNAPRGEGIFRQVKAAYPAFGFGEEGKEFAKIYDKALSSAREQINKNGSISVWEIPQYLRDAILKPS